MAGLILNLPKVNDRRGNLTFIESDDHVPFGIQRVYYIYDIPGGESRAGHALKNTHQFLVAITGSFDVMLDDGASQTKFSLNRSYYGIYIKPGVWRVLNNFSSGAVCLALASSKYDPDEYIRNLGDFRSL